MKTHQANSLFRRHFGFHDSLLNMDDLREIQNIYKNAKRRKIYGMEVLDLDYNCLMKKVYDAILKLGKKITTEQMQYVLKYEKVFMNKD